jgi:two-component system heavy metal sensor histidine kinase CusS
MKRCSLKVRVGAYSCLVTIASLLAGAAVLLPIVRHHQLVQVDRMMKDGADELLWDLVNFRDAPRDPRSRLEQRFLPFVLQRHSLQVVGLEGQDLYRSPDPLDAPLEVAAGEVRTIDHEGKPVRVGAWQEGPYLVKVGASLSSVLEFQDELRRGLMIAVPVTGLLAFVGGMLLGGRAVAPVTKLGEAAERISVHAPDERLPAPRSEDEIGRLTRVLNRSFDRLQASYDSATRFGADASHQLKTPVAILRAGLDHLSRETGLTPAQAAEVAVLIQQTRRLTALIDDLLMLSKADAGRLQLETTPVDLVPLVAAAIDDLQTLSADKKLRVETALPEVLEARADRKAVTIILQNLVENAAKYTPDGGAVKIHAHQDGTGVTLGVANTGPGLSPDDRERIFERFHRGPVVGENIRGHGLGLSIARELARAHGGELQVTDAPAGWIEFSLRLPAAAG